MPMCFRFRFLFALIAVFGFASPSLALNCKEVRKLAGVYFKMHFSQHNFDDELSKRTLSAYIKSWDPGKVYFLASDVERFEKEYGAKLDDMILDSNCKAIDDIINVYGKRFQERQPVIKKHIDAAHDFKVDEYMMIDRKKMEWAKTTEEVSDRWRKRIKFQLMQLKSATVDLKAARDKLKKRYDIVLKRQNEMTSDEAYSMFLNSFSASLDPHTEYYTAEALEDFRISTSLSLEGIGAVLRSEDGFTNIQSLVPGGAAAKTGKVKVDDKIIAVAQGKETPVDVIDMDLREVVKLIRGTRGTEVRLTVVREDGKKTQQFVVPIIREKIQLEDREAKSYVHEVTIKEPGTKIAKAVKVGVIDLPSFYMDFQGRQNRVRDFKSSSADMLRELESLKKQKVDAIVVDLRSNGGGSLDESINIAGLFFDKGPVVQIKDQRGNTYVQEDEDGKTYYDGPLLVMINRQSASASEIFAGAIQDYGRGLIVGDTHTFGKGTVQNLNDIDEKLGAIKVTISKFFRPSGSSTQLRGVESDIVLPDLLDEYEIGEKYYDYALPWEKIQVSKYQDFNKVGPYREALTKASEKRIKSLDTFKETFTAIEEYRKGEEERARVSLKEDKDNTAKIDEELSETDELAESDAIPDLSKDPTMQETLRIAGDYVQLLAGKKLGEMEIPALKINVAETGKSIEKDVSNKP